MERRDDQTACVSAFTTGGREDFLDALAHLGGGFVRKCERQNRPSRHALLHEVRDPPRDDARLARARRSQHEHRAFESRGRGPLRIGEPLKEW